MRVIGLELLQNALLELFQIPQEPLDVDPVPLESILMKGLLHVRMPQWDIIHLVMLVRL